MNLRVGDVVTKYRKLPFGSLRFVTPFIVSIVGTKFPPIIVFPLGPNATASVFNPELGLFT